MLTLIGMGGGAPGCLTLQSLAALQEADCILGAQRLLDGLPADCTAPREPVYLPDAILERLHRYPERHFAVLYSGDTGFYSAASALTQRLNQENIPFWICPGLSSVQLLAAALGQPWQEWKLISAHGRDCDPVIPCMEGRPVFFLTDPVNTPTVLCAKLDAAGLGASSAVVGQRLGTEGQSVIQGSVAGLARQSFDPLNVLLVTPPAPAQPRCTGWPDTAFVRGEVPMTKQEVRAAALAKLAVRPADLLWDIGAGTGSVSIEMALAAPQGSVYAVECMPDACALIRENRARFGAWNLTLVEGRAPAALTRLPAPDAVFIGGTKGQMQPIVDAVLEKNPCARICIAAIALETLGAAAAALAARGLTVQVAQIAVSRTRTAGTLHLLAANNPVFLITGNCE
ncbi:MAG: precorrin-6y C5,15-methyltransferase (decarboxylating) subunit CbiE [Faecalibacterium sp.]